MKNFVISLFPDWMGSPFERVVCGDFNGELKNT